MNHRSLAFRLGAWYTLLLGATFILVGLAAFVGLRHYLRAAMHDSLTRRTAQIEQILARAPADATSAEIAREIETRVAPEFNNRFVRVTRPPDRVIYRSGQPADRSFDPAGVDAIDWARSPEPKSSSTVTVSGQHLMVSGTPIDTLSGPYLVELGVSTEPIEAVLQRLLDLLALLLPILTVFAAVGGYLLVSWALRPVDQISQTAEKMSLLNLEARLPVAPTGDALERLSISLNNMLARLADSVQRSRRFLADASHELRTPLTVIKGELQELTCGGSLTKRDLDEHVGSVLEEVDRLEHLVSGLLVLSRLDAGETPINRVDVDLAALARSIAEEMRLIADDRGIEIELSSLDNAVVSGDRARLKQVIVNLLDNAIRFTPRGGIVRLRTASDERGSFFEINDSGAGIPRSSLPFVFDRFYRVDHGRSREDGGAGLGLSIVKSISTMHGAEVEVESELDHGSSFRVIFPKARTAGVTAVSSVPDGSCIASRVS